MFSFSSKTVVNKEYKIKDFLKEINASKEVKEDAKVIKQIFFDNVIKAETLNTKEDDNFKEIYIIHLKLNDKKIPQLFVEKLDNNISLHTYFIFEYENHFATEMAYKEIGQKVKINSSYFKHDFALDKEIDVPMINSVKDAYMFMLSYETGVKNKNEETPSDYISRVKAIRKLEYQISKTQQAINFQVQPKKKFEYNERLREYKKELDNLLK